MSSYGQSIFIYEPDGSQNFCVVNLGINQWSPSYVDLRINLFYLWHPVTATPCRDKFNGGSTIDPHLMQINGFIYFIFDILWQLHPVGTNSMKDQPLISILCRSTDSFISFLTSFDSYTLSGQIQWRIKHWLKVPTLDIENKRFHTKVLISGLIICIVIEGWLVVISVFSCRALHLLTHPTHYSSLILIQCLTP